MTTEKDGGYSSNPLLAMSLSTKLGDLSSRFPCDESCEEAANLKELVSSNYDDDCREDLKPAAAAAAIELFDKLSSAAAPPPLDYLSELDIVIDICFGASAIPSDSLLILLLLLLRLLLMLLLLLLFMFLLILMLLLLLMLILLLVLMLLLALMLLLSLLLRIDSFRDV